MAGTKICPLFTVMMNIETACYGESCAWAIKEEETTGSPVRFEPVCCQWVIAAELRRATNELRRLTQLPASQ